MRSLLAFTLLLGCVTVALAEKPKGPPVPKGKEYVSKEGRFRVQQVGEPKSESKNLSTAAGVLEVKTERFEGVRDVMLAVVYTDYPESFREVDSRKLIDGVCEGMRGVDGKITRSREDTLGEGESTSTGRAVRIEAGRNVIQARVFFVGNRLYQVMVSGPRDPVEGKVAQDFLSSFDLAK